MVTACDGCLGDQLCWVCLGTGELERPGLRRGPCHRCAGTGRCALCRPTSINLRETIDLNGEKLTDHSRRDGA